jgi:hypothetical protein
MAICLRLSLCVALALAALTILVGCFPFVAPDLCRLPTDLGALLRAQQRDRDLAAAEEVFQRRDVIMTETARDLLAQRVTLLEAAAQIRDMPVPVCAFNLDVFLAANPGETPAESYCRAAIGAVSGYLSDQPGAADAVRRLEAELQRHLEHGPLHLPARGAPAARSVPGIEPLWFP